MGTTLTGTTPATTYDGLIKVTDNGPLSGTAKYLSDGLGNDSALALSTAGIGIGTDAPANKLDVLATSGDGIRIANTTAAAYNASLLVNLNDVSTMQLNCLGSTILQAGNTGNTILSSRGASASILFSPVGSERMRITEAGLVGIGTSAPDNGLLTIVKNTTSASENTYGIAIQSNPVVGYTELLIGADDALDAGIIQTAAKGTSFSTRKLLLNPNGGNVGIGTSSPTAALHIIGADENQLRLGTADTEWYQIGRDASSGLLYFYGSQPSYAGYVFTGVDGERIRITSAGNVGIGTSSPNALGTSGAASVARALEISGNGSAGIRLTDSSGVNLFLDINVDASVAEIGAYYSTTPTLNLNAYGVINFKRQNTTIASITQQGLTFNGDTAAANALDDYEEGTWTATLRGSVSDPTAAVTGTGKYTKIGRIVTAEIQLDAKNTTGAGGSVTVTGLPFTSSVEAQGAMMSESYTFGASCTSVNCFVSPFSNLLNFFTSGSSVAWAPLVHSAGFGRSLRATITYQV